MNNQEWTQEGQKYVMNTYGRLPLAIVRGKGAVVWDADGKEYLDFVAGIAVNNLGHCHPKVVQAVKDQAETLLHCSNLYWIEPQIKLAKMLVNNSCFDKVFFCNSGGEANEGAIKLARKYAKKHMGTDKYEIITMKQSFHGRTLATLTATGQEKYHQGYEPLPAGFSYSPFNDLEALKKNIGPHTCAVLLEPVQGEGGVVPGQDDFIKGVRKLCDENKLLFIVDEVQCGLGRSGKLFAYEHYDIEPDIMTLAKALGGGAPIGALLAKEEVAGAFQPGDHAATFGGNPLVTAAGVATLTVMLEEDLAQNAQMAGEYFICKLEALKKKYPFIKEIRGKGLMIGVECEKEVAGIINDCLAKGLLILSAGPKVLRFLPPLNITFSQIDQAMEILESALAN
ncbi:acetylornithine transaminase [Dehalobacterium formicoaceticum]|uniref:acetylornithine transaminase n=1 Tax=Dehalobacterium formicoaceticum TaxID=51515 RepID=UPI0031F6BA84